MRYNVNHSELKQLCQQACATDYMQVISTNVEFLNIPVQCSCSTTVLQ